MARRAKFSRMIKLALPCPHCGKEGMESVARLIAYDEMPCSFCGGVIDLRTEERRAYINEIANTLGHIGPAYQKLT